MTINLLTGVPAGVVLLADSMLTLSGEVLTTFENAEKLIELGSNSTPAAAMISGAGDVNGKLVSFLLRKSGREVDTLITALAPISHEHVTSAVRNSVDPEWNAGCARLRIEAAAWYSKIDELAKINESLTSQGKPTLLQIEPHHISIEGQNDNHADAFLPVQASSLTVVVATYFDETPRATALNWPGVAREVNLPDLAWWGSGGNAVARVLLGYDEGKLRQKAWAETRQVPPGNVGPAQQALGYMESQRSEFQMGLPIQSLPLQDAIEFTEYLGRVACGFDRFSIGQASVGGPLDVLVLLPGERRWIHRKELHSSQA